MTDLNPRAAGLQPAGSAFRRHRVSIDFDTRPDLLTLPAGCKPAASSFTVHLRWPDLPSNTRPTSSDDALPELVSRIEDELEPLRQQATCRTGCSACCRQLVPLAPAEARRLRRVAGKLPDVRQRVARTRNQLDDMGLLDLLDDLDGTHHAAPAELVHDLAREWAEAKVACPFLNEDQSCSIYHDRPLACRLKLVRSEPQHCSGDGTNVVPLRVRGRASVGALARVENATWMPMTSIFRPLPPAVLGDDWAARFDKERGLPEVAVTQPTEQESQGFLQVPRHLARRRRFGGGIEQGDALCV